MRLPRFRRLDATPVRGDLTLSLRWGGVLGAGLALASSLPAALPGAGTDLLGMGEGVGTDLFQTRVATLEPRRATRPVVAVHPSAGAGGWPVHPAEFGKPSQAFRLDALYPKQVMTDPAWLARLIAEGRFMAEGEASYYWVGKKTANTEPFRAEAMTAAILGYFSEPGCFAYFPKAYRGGYPLLVVHEGSDKVTRYAFVRVNDRGPYTGPRKTQPCGWSSAKGPRADRTRPIDLSRGAMRVFMESISGQKLTDRQLYARGILRGVKLYLPPLDRIPEAPIHDGTGRNVRGVISDLLRDYPPPPGPRNAAGEAVD